MKEAKNISFKKLARNISIVENEAENHEELLQQLTIGDAAIIGITGPPGAGKSTLTDALIELITNENKTVAVVCIDPTSPYHNGSLLGDRIRMDRWFNNANVYIRSLATRGSVGGLNNKIIEVTDVLKAAGFDYILIETVGVGQNETDIARLANVTIVVLVPEAGDEIQNMKAGLMEIGDLFVVNKSDRPEADAFAGTLKKILSFNNDQAKEVIKTVATAKQGIETLWNNIKLHLNSGNNSEKKFHLLAEKAYFIIQREKMRSIKRADLETTIKEEWSTAFNIYSFVKKYS